MWKLSVCLWADEDPDTRTNGYGVCAYLLTELRSHGVECVRSTVVHGGEVRAAEDVSVSTSSIRSCQSCALIGLLSLGTALINHTNQVPAVTGWDRG